jgi:hypothetical protein
VGHQYLAASVRPQITFPTQNAWAASALISWQTSARSCRCAPSACSSAFPIQNVSTAELAVLARALDTAPVALLYPPPYQGEIEVLPGQTSTTWSAAEWFSGMSDGAAAGASADDAEAYDRNLAPLRAAARISELTARKQRLMDALVGADEAVQAAMLDAIHGVQDDIDRLSNVEG